MTIKVIYENEDELELIDGTREPLCILVVWQSAGLACLIGGAIVSQHDDNHQAAGVLVVIIGILITIHTLLNISAARREHVLLCKSQDTMRNSIVCLFQACYDEESTSTAGVQQIVVTRLISSGQEERYEYQIRLLVGNNTALRLFQRKIQLRSVTERLVPEQIRKVAVQMARFYKLRLPVQILGVDWIVANEDEETTDCRRLIAKMVPWLVRQPARSVRGQSRTELFTSSSDWMEVLCESCCEVNCFPDMQYAKPRKCSKCRTAIPVELLHPRQTPPTSPNI
eukprot:GILJ01004943.1.p1 GENE.GILJ01004943.1~~GILJ01004943.1.p1  ORF type:complete len:283 (+),score=18.69 GILJ01004943.1:78-926(+)